MIISVASTHCSVKPLSSRQTWYSWRSTKPSRRELRACTDRNSLSNFITRPLALKTIAGKQFESVRTSTRSPDSKYRRTSKRQSLVLSNSSDRRVPTFLWFIHWVLVHVVGHLILYHHQRNKRIQTRTTGRRHPSINLQKWSNHFHDIYIQTFFLSLFTTKIFRLSLLGYLRVTNLTIFHFSCRR